MTSTLDLFAESAAEVFEERAAIAEFDGLLTREDAERLALTESEAYRMACEVRHLLSLPLADRREQLALIERARGTIAADQLKAAVAQEWTRRKGNL